MLIAIYVSDSLYTRTLKRNNFCLVNINNDTSKTQCVFYAVQLAKLQQRQILIPYMTQDTKLLCL